MEDSIVALVTVQDAQVQKKSIEAELLANLLTFQEVTGCHISGVNLSFDYGKTPVQIKGVVITVSL
jgi:hypothetical protein